MTVMDQWIEVPAIDKYPGMTKLVRQGRYFQCVGLGQEVRDALDAHATEQLACCGLMVDGKPCGKPVKENDDG